MDEQKEPKEEQEEKKKGFPLDIMIFICVSIVLGIILLIFIWHELNRSLGPHPHLHTRIQIENFKIACHSFNLDNKQYPQKLDDLIKDPGVYRWKGPYLDQMNEIPKDRWGNAFRYQLGGEKDFVITSAGEDGKFGTDDDISNLKKDY